MELALGIIGGVLVTAALAAGFWRFSRPDTSQVADDLASARLSLAEAETRLRSETERADTLAHERDDAREQARLHAEELAQTRLARTEAETRLKSETERADTLTRERDAAREQARLHAEELAQTRLTRTEAETQLKSESERADTLTRERDAAREEARTREGELAQARTEGARLTANHQARMEEIEKARGELERKFKGIADEVMRTSNENFLKQANAQFDVREQAVRHLVEPVGKDLEKLQNHIGEIEKARSGAYANIQTLITETGKQVDALNRSFRSPRIRGHWGEQQLENLFEMSQLRENVDYYKQVTAVTEEGSQRPDFIVNIPGWMQVVIDAKVPLESYLDAHETEDEQEQAKLLDRHAASVVSHARALGRKDYAKAADGSLDLVVLFLPADPILDAAMRANASVWTDAWLQHKVLIATPSIIIALLHTIAAALQQAEMQQNAEEIAEAAKELCERIRVYAEHIDNVGKGLRRAVTAYDKGIGSFNSRLLPSVRRVEDLGRVSEARQIEAPETLDIAPRRLSLWEDGEEDEG